MTDLYEQLYDEFLTEQDDEFIDNDLPDPDELYEDLPDPDDSPDEDLLTVNIIRLERNEPETRIVLIPTENSLPKITNESLRLAEYLKLRSEIMPHGDVLCKIKNDGLEEPRLDLTKILSRWFPGKNVRWISLKCIGASNYCVSSDGDVCHIHARRLIKPDMERHARAGIILDNGMSVRIPVHNLVACAFWEFPAKLQLTVDHHNRMHHDNNYLNLSWETKATQRLNQKKYGRKAIPVNQIDPVDRKLIKEWNRSSEIAKHFNVQSETIWRAIVHHQIFRNFLWEYHEPFLEGEEFRLILIEGLNDIFISNHGRCMLRNGHITDGTSCSGGYRGVGLRNTLIGDRTYYLHILVAMMWIPNDCSSRTIVNHKDHVRDNNVVGNLEWVTPSENNKHANRRRRCVNYTDDNGQLHEFASIIEASNSTKVSRTVIISECRQSQVGKVARFRYVDEYISKGSGGGAPVVQCDILTGSSLFVWETIACAELHTKSSRDAITRVLLGNAKSGNGFFWRRPTIFEAPGDVTKISDISILRTKNNRIRDDIVEIYEINNDLVINIYNSIQQAREKTGVYAAMIRLLIKGRKNGYDKGDGIVRWFLCRPEYERRIENKEPLIQAIEITDDTNNPIVVMTLTGEFIEEFLTAKDAAVFVRVNTTGRSNFGPSKIIDIARGNVNSFRGFRFAFAEDYHRNPNSYKENLNVSILKTIKKSMS